MCEYLHFTGLKISAILGAQLNNTEQHDMTPIEQIRAYALEQYENRDLLWDEVVECYDDSEIQEILDLSTVNGDVQKFIAYMEDWMAPVADARNENWRGATADYLDAGKAYDGQPTIW